MQSACWTAPPQALATEPERVYIFRLRLDLPEDRLADLRAYLSPDELARANRYRSPRDGARFTAAHGQLREILSGYTQVNPKKIDFCTGERGKPALIPLNAPVFNLSHSAELALLAVAPAGTDLGVDVEAVRAHVEFESMARRFFAPGEVAALLALPTDQRTTAFFACWTRKEAYMKARGLGLAIPLDGFEVSLAPGEPPRLLRPAADDPHGQEWTMMEIAPGPGFAAALCVRGPVSGIRCWDWPGSGMV